MGRFVKNHLGQDVYVPSLQEQGYNVPETPDFFDPTLSDLVSPISGAGAGVPDIEVQQPVIYDEERMQFENLLLDEEQNRRMRQRALDEQRRGVHLDDDRPFMGVSPRESFLDRVRQQDEQQKREAEQNRIASERDENRRRRLAKQQQTRSRKEALLNSPEALEKIKAVHQGTMSEDDFKTWWVSQQDPENAYAWEIGVEGDAYQKLWARLNTESSMSDLSGKLSGATRPRTGAGAAMGMPDYPVSDPETRDTILAELKEEHDQRELEKQKRRRRAIALGEPLEEYEPKQFDPYSYETYELFKQRVKDIANTNVLRTESTEEDLSRAKRVHSSLFEDERKSPEELEKAKSQVQQAYTDAVDASQKMSPEGQEQFVEEFVSRQLAGNDIRISDPAVKKQFFDNSVLSNVQHRAKVKELTSTTLQMSEKLASLNKSYSELNAKYESTDWPSVAPQQLGPYSDPEFRKEIHEKQKQERQLAKQREDAFFEKLEFEKEFDSFIESAQAMLDDPTIPSSLKRQIRLTISVANKRRVSSDVEDNYDFRAVNQVNQLNATGYWDQLEKRTGKELSPQEKLDNVKNSYTPTELYVNDKTQEFLYKHNYAAALNEISGYTAGDYPLQILRAIGEGFSGFVQGGAGIPAALGVPGAQHDAVKLNETLNKWGEGFEKYTQQTFGEGRNVLFMGLKPQQFRGVLSSMYQSFTLGGLKIGWRGIGAGFGVNEFGRAFAEGRGEGMSHGSASLYAGLMGSAEALPAMVLGGTNKWAAHLTQNGTLSPSALKGLLATQKSLKDLTFNATKTLGTELVEESLTTIAQTFVDGSFIHEDENFFSENIGPALLEMAETVFAQTALMGGLGGTGEIRRGRRYKKKLDQRSQNALNRMYAKLAPLTGQIRTSGSLSDRMAEVINRISPAGAAQLRKLREQGKKISRSTIEKLYGPEMAGRLTKLEQREAFADAILGQKQRARQEVIDNSPVLQESPTKVLDVEDQQTGERNVVTVNVEQGQTAQEAVDEQIRTATGEAPVVVAEPDTESLGIRDPDSIMLEIQGLEESIINPETTPAEREAFEKRKRVLEKALNKKLRDRKKETPEAEAPAETPAEGEQSTVDTSFVDDPEGSLTMLIPAEKRSRWKRVAAKIASITRGLIIRPGNRQAGMSVSGDGSLTVEAMFDQAIDLRGGEDVALVPIVSEEVAHHAAAVSNENHSEIYQGLWSRLSKSVQAVIETAYFHSAAYSAKSFFDSVFDQYAQQRMMDKVTGRGSEGSLSQEQAAAHVAGSEIFRMLMQRRMGITITESLKRTDETDAEYQQRQGKLNETLDAVEESLTSEENAAINAAIGEFSTFMDIPGQAEAAPTKTPTETTPTEAAPEQRPPAGSREGVELRLSEIDAEIEEAGAALPPGVAKEVDDLFARVSDRRGRSEETIEFAKNTGIDFEKLKNYHDLLNEKETLEWRIKNSFFPGETPTHAVSEATTESAPKTTSEFSPEGKRLADVANELGELIESATTKQDKKSVLGHWNRFDVKAKQSIFASFTESQKQQLYEIELDAKTIPQLKAQLKEMGVKGYSGKNKAGLIKMILEAQAPTEAAPEAAPETAGLGVSPIVGDMLGALGKSLEQIRERVSNVKQGPIRNGVETFTFEFDGNEYEGRQEGVLRDVVVGANSEADAKIASTALVQKLAKLIGKPTPTEAAEGTYAPKKDYEIESVLNEFGEVDFDADKALRKIAKERDLGITSDREASTVVRNEDGEVIGGTFVSDDGGNYTFDVVVSEAAEGTGVGSKLLDDVIEMPYELREINPDATMQVDVVSPKMKEMLERRGFEVKKEIGKNRWLMEPKDYDNVGKPKVAGPTPAPKTPEATTPTEATPAEKQQQKADEAKRKLGESFRDMMGGMQAAPWSNKPNAERRQKFIENLANYLYEQAKATGLKVTELGREWYKKNSEKLKTGERQNLKKIVTEAATNATERLRKDPSKKPTPTPEGEFSEEVYSIKNANVDADLEALNLPKPAPAETLAFNEAMDEAATATEQDADSLVTDLLDNPRAPSPWEDALLNVAYMRAKKNYDNAKKRLAEVSGQGGEAESNAKKDLDAAHEKYEKVYMASRLTGTESGRSLAFRRMMIREDYSLVSMEYEARISNEGELSKKQKEEVAKLQKRIEELQSQLSDVESRRNNNKAEEKFKAEDEKIRRQTRRRKPGKAKIVTDEARDAAIERIKKRRQTTLTSGVNPEDIYDATLIGVNLLENGVNKFSAWSSQIVEIVGDTIKPHLKDMWKGARSQVAQLFVDETSSALAQADKDGKKINYNRQARKIYKEFVAMGQDMPTALKSTHEVFNDAVEEDFTIEQVRDFVSGYGVWKELSKEDLEVRLRDDIGQYQQLAKIEALLRGDAPKKTGVERREASDKERLLMKEVERLKKAGNYIDAEQTLKSAFASMKTRLENQIKDLDNARKLKTPIDKRSKLQLTKEQQDEIDEITKRLDIAKAEYKAMFPPETKKLDDQDRLAAAIKRTEQRIEKLEDHIERGVPIDEPSTVEPNEELRKLQEKRDKLTQEYRQMAPVKEAAEERKLAAALRQTEKSIEDLRNALATGKAIPKSAQPLVNDALNKLRAERDQLREQYKKRFPSPRKLMTDQQKIEREIKNTERSIEQLEQALKNKTPLERKQAGPTNKKLDALRKKRADLRTRYNKEIGAAQKLERDIKAAEQTIAEMENALRTGKPLPKRPKGKVDPVLAKIHERRNEVRRRYREKFPPTRTAAQRIAYAEKALERAIERNKKRIRDKDIGPVKGKKARSARLDALRAENEALLAELRALKPKLTQEQKDTRRKIAELKRRIKQRKQALASGEYKTEQRQSEANLNDPTLKKLNKEKDRLDDKFQAEFGPQMALDQEKARVKRRIADTRARIASGQFSTEKKSPQEKKDDDEMRQLRLEEMNAKREFNKLKAKYEWDNMGVTSKASRVVWRLYDAIRAMKASWDTSGFRQAAFASMAQPRKALQAGGKMLTGMWTEKQRLAIEDELKKHPRYDEAKQRGVAFTEIGGDLTATEEEYMFSATAFSGKTWKTLSYPYAVSERAFSTLLNVMRLEYYVAVVDGLPLTTQEQKDLALHVNDATGRGGVGPNSVALTRAFWSPRLLISRWNLLTFRSIRDPDVSWRAKKLILKQYARAMRSVGVLLMLVAASRWDEDWEDIFDLTSSKVATIKIGNTYIDPWGGMKQLAVFMARIGFREKTNWEGEVVPLDEGVYGQNVWNEISRFALTKLNPAFGLAISYAQKSDMIGRPMTEGRAMYEAVAPLAPQEGLVAIKEEGLITGTFLGLLGMMGASLMIDDEENLSSYEQIFGPLEGPKEKRKAERERKKQQAEELKALGMDDESLGLDFDY